MSVELPRLEGQGQAGEAPAQVDVGEEVQAEADDPHVHGLMFRSPRELPVLFGPT